MKENLIEEIFGIRKPIIGVIHLKPLIGSLNYKGLDYVIDFALKDLKNLEEGGVNGIIIENYGDMPFYPNKVPEHVISCFSILANEIKKETNLPLGINVLRNDAISSLAIATVIKANFIRVNVYCGAMVTDQGIIQGKSYEILRYREFLKSNVKIFADVFVKHAFPLGYKNIVIASKDVYFRGKADALIVTGEETGKEANLEDIMNIKKETNAPIIVGSGINPNNIINYLKLCDGVIVGTYFKKEGRIENQVDLKRVKKLVEIVKKLK